MGSLCFWWGVNELVPGHQVNWDGATVMEIESHQGKRKILEAIQIQGHAPQYCQPGQRTYFEPCLVQVH